MNKQNNHLKLSNKKINKADNFFYRSFILHEYKAIYFILPKCACTSILATCAESIGMKFTGNFRKDNLHLLKTSQDKIFNQYNDYLKFSFVRNPWDRVVSCYRQKIANPDPSKFPNSITKTLSKLNLYKPQMSFEDFVKIISIIPDQKSDPHFRSQHNFMISNQGDFFLDYVGKIENLNQDFADLSNLIGVKKFAIPHKNKSVFLANKNYAEFYTDETKAIIEKRYSIDIDLFQYSFQ